MKRLNWLSALLLILTANRTMAQLKVQATMDRGRYIMYEPIRVRVRIRNYTGRTLRFGPNPEEGGYMRFEIMTYQGEQVEKRQHADPSTGLKLPRGAEKQIVIQLNNLFELYKSGRYELRVRVGHRILKQDYLSSPVSFEVQEGVPVWKQEVGLASTQTNARLQSRTCSLNIFRAEHHDLYYLMIEDEKSVYAVIRVGPRVRGIHPQAEIDARNRIHILIQVVPRLFRHWVFDLNGKVLEKQLYVIGTNIPQLSRDPDIGRVMVIGGRPAVAGVDYNVKNPHPPKPPTIFPDKQKNGEKKKKWFSISRLFPFLHRKKPGKATP